LTATGTTYVTLDRELFGNVRLNIVHDRAAGHITVVELELNHGEVTNRLIMDNF
jgi:hypothetical protein